MSSNRLTTETVCLPKEATIRQAMEKINQNCLGVVFILDGGLLLGAVTDGDFRRLVLTGAIDLEASVEGLMNESPATLSVGAGAEETFRALSDGLERGKKVFPRVDLDGQSRVFPTVRTGVFCLWLNLHSLETKRPTFCNASKTIGCHPAVLSSHSLNVHSLSSRD